MLQVLFSFIQAGYTLTFSSALSLDLDRPNPTVDHDDPPSPSNRPVGSRRHVSLCVNCAAPDIFHGTFIQSQAKVHGEFRGCRCAVPLLNVFFAGVHGWKVKAPARVAR